MRATTSLTLIVCCAILTTGGALVTFAGPLNPPNGPVMATYKTLSEVEPRTEINAANTPGDADSTFKISTPGSYYLTGNITGVSGKSGIEVAANCTIDLRGFQLTGVNGSLDGILLVGEFRGTVRGGQVVGWGGDGISGGQCNSCLFEDLYLEGNGSSGLVAGRDSVISRVRSASNVSDGIRVDGFCTIVDCVGSGNVNGFGIDAGSYSRVARCNARANSVGLKAGEGGSIEDCIATDNFNGVQAENGATVRDTTVSDNGSVGIYCTGRLNRIEGNVCKSNQYGIYLPQGGGNLVIRNFATANSVASYYDPSGNNTGQVLTDPGYFTSTNAWANIAGN